MKISIKAAFILLLTLVMTFGLFCLPTVAAVEGEILSLEAGYAPGRVSVSGTADPGVLAVAVLLYDGETLLRLATASVHDGSFAADIAITLAPGTYLAKAADYDGGPFAEAGFRVAGPTGGKTAAPGAPGYQAVVSGGGSLPVQVNAGTNSATVNLGPIAGNLAGGGHIAVTWPAIPGLDAYCASLPTSALSSPAAGSLTINTGAVSITLPGNMLAGTGLAGQAEITISAGDKESLPDDLRAAIGQRPIIRLTLAIDGKQTDWHNPDAPVILRIPYTPAGAELADPESIVVWYLDGGGHAVCVANGHYDSESGTVTVKITHFSDYAVAYHPVGFNDLPPGAWYDQAVRFIAAREITTGTGGGYYSPGANLTRGEFIVLLLRAYNIAPAQNPMDNFSDSGQAYYSGYLATAKRLGISGGAGDNKFEPARAINRQEMFTLLYHTLRVTGQLPEGATGRTLAHFTDAGEIDAWAGEALALLIKTGTINGNGGALSPLSNATRAEMAQLLYNLLGHTEKNGDKGGE